MRVHQLRAFCAIIASTGALQLTGLAIALSPNLLSPRAPASSPAGGDENAAVRRIAGRRCLLSPARRRPPGPPPPIPGDDSSAPRPPPPRPPLVLIGGMAQSVESWEIHLPSLSLDRDVLVYECLGQGPAAPRDGGLSPSYYRNVTLPFHAASFAEVVREAFPSSSLPVDVAGFSFGGRVAMAAVSCHPDLIRRVHVTGVAAQRDGYGRLVLKSWEDVLRRRSPPRGDSVDDDVRLRAFGWSILTATYSDSFLSARGGDEVQSWVDQICRSNTIEGLSALLTQTHGSSDEDFWEPLSMAKRITALKRPARGMLTVGSLDRMSTPGEARRLSSSLGWDDVRTYEGSGHAVPMERAREWRNDLLRFLDEE